MKKETWIFKNGRFIQATKWNLFCRKIHSLITRFKIVDTRKYNLIPHSDSKYYFKLSLKEYNDAEKIYKENGTISYEFYPCGGIGWGVKIHCLDKDNKIIDITDTTCW